MKTANGFSTAEVNLIQELGYQWLLEPVSRGSIVEPKAYEVMALEVFTEGKEGPEVEALRRVMKAIKNCEPYRLTSEFDELCRFEKDMQN